MQTSKKNKSNEYDGFVQSMLINQRSIESYRGNEGIAQGCSDARCKLCSLYKCGRSKC